MKKSISKPATFSLIICLCLVAFGCRSSEKNAESRNGDQESTRPVGWELADYLLASRSQALSILDKDDLHYATEYTPEYFRSLKARSESVKAWATLTKPHLVYFGYGHPNSIAPSTTTEERLEIYRRQYQLIFDNVSLESRDAQLIATENSDCVNGERLTPEVAVRIMRASAEFLGEDMSEEQAKDIVSRSLMPDLRAVFELNVPVFCGEEWPKDFQLVLIYELLLQPHPLKSDGDIMDAFGTLRSEIMLIRTLETLRSVGGHKGLMIQGEGHRKDIEELAPQYNVDLESYPDPPID
ncbi:MAG: hypothetical protein WC750_00555 [Patescibacteria group bacterium]